MKKKYIPPVTETAEAGTIGMLAISNIPIGGNTGRFDAPTQKREWGNLWK